MDTPRYGDTHWYTYEYTHGDIVIIMVLYTGNYSMSTSAIVTAKVSQAGFIIV